MRTNWIIGICNTSTDGVKLMRFYGTENEIKEFLVKLVSEDKSKDETYDYGTEDVDEITTDFFGGLYAYGNYCEYHIDYSAKKIGDIELEIL